MNVNAELTIKFDNQTIALPVEWSGLTLLGAEEITERIFFSDEFEEELKNGMPDMDVVSKTNKAVYSRVWFEAEFGELYSTKSFETASKTK